MGCISHTACRHKTSLYVELQPWRTFSLARPLQLDSSRTFRVQTRLEGGVDGRDGGCNSCLNWAGTGEGGGKRRFGRATAPLITDEVSHKVGGNKKQLTVQWKDRNKCRCFCCSHWPLAQVTRPPPRLRGYGTFLQKTVWPPFFSKNQVGKTVKKDPPLQYSSCTCTPEHDKWFTV